MEISNASNWLGTVEKYIITVDKRLIREVFEEVFLVEFCKYMDENKAFIKFIGK